MFREVLEFLTADGWPLQEDSYDGLPCIRSRFIGTQHSWDCRIRPYDPFGQLIFESLLPSVDAAARPAVTDLILRVNWRLLTGAFHLDVDTGDLLFRNSVFLSHGEQLSEGLMRDMVYSNVLTVDRCVVDLLDAAAGADPVAAFEHMAL